MSQKPYPIALLCAKTASGDIFGRALPLWKLLPGGAFAITTREQLSNALDEAERVAQLLGGGSEGFAVKCGERQTMVATLGDACPDEASARALLSKIDSSMMPGPIAKLGNGTLDASLTLSAHDGFGDHLAQIDKLGAQLPKPQPTAQEQKILDRQTANKMLRRRLLSREPDCAPIAFISVTSNFSSPDMMSAMPMYFSSTIAAPLWAVMDISWANRAPKTTAQAELLLADFHASVLELSTKASSPNWVICHHKHNNKAPRMDPVGPRWALSIDLTGDTFHSSDPAATLAKMLAPLLARLGPEARICKENLDEFGFSDGDGQTAQTVIKSDAGLQSMIQAADLELSIKPGLSSKGGKTVL